MSSAQQAPERQVFVSRSAFILAAIGSAIGLGNIWRFPYVAYDSGGGAFIIPYLIALLTAGIPLLFVVYAIGHRSRSWLRWRTGPCTGPQSRSAGSRPASRPSSASTTP